MLEIAFTGDIAFSKYFKDSYADAELIAPELVEFLSSADFVVPNVEGALTSGVMKRGDSSTPAHASDPRSVSWLQKIKGNIWNLSNNHTLDCGESGLLDTINLAKSHNCRILGAGMNVKEASTPVVINDIGLFAVCYKKLFEAGENKAGIIHWDDYKSIKKAIREIKKNNRWCILIVHGGEEFSNMPLPFVRKKYMRYLKYGADIIVGHHPHVPQNYETVGKKTIFYSLGNLIFDTDYQRLQRNTDKGILLKLKLTQDSYTWDFMPYQINREKKCVEKSECPAVFRNVTAKEYKRISPLVVKTFLDDYRRAKIFLKPYMEKYSKVQWAKWYIKNKGFFASLSLLNDRARYEIGNWKKADIDLINYLRP